MIFEHGPHGGVAFIELKGKVDPEAPSRPFEQIRGAVEHFSNTEVHGGQHHEQWARGDDRPSATAGRQQIPITLGAEHLTLGAIVISRGGTRIPPRTFECGGRRCMILVVQKHGRRGRRTLGLSELLEQAGH